MLAGKLTNERLWMATMVLIVIQEFWNNTAKYKYLVLVHFLNVSGQYVDNRWSFVAV